MRSLVMPAATPYISTAPVRGVIRATPPGEPPIQSEPSRSGTTARTRLLAKPLLSVQLFQRGGSPARTFNPDSVPAHSLPEASRAMAHTSGFVRPSASVHDSHWL